MSSNLIKLGDISNLIKLEEITYVKAKSRKNGYQTSKTLIFSINMKFLNYLNQTKLSISIYYAIWQLNK